MLNQGSFALASVEKMLQESLGGSGESVASTKRALAQAQKLLQLASVRPNALTLREYREALEVLASSSIVFRVIATERLVNICANILRLLLYRNA